MANGDSEKVYETLRDLLIVQLCVAGVPQQVTAKIVGCNIVRVNKIAKHLRRNAKSPK